MATASAPSRSAGGCRPRGHRSADRARPTRGSGSSARGTDAWPAPPGRGSRGGSGERGSWRPPRASPPRRGVPTPQPPAAAPPGRARSPGCPGRGSLTAGDTALSPSRAWRRQVSEAQAPRPRGSGLKPQPVSPSPSPPCCSDPPRPPGSSRLPLAPRGKGRQPGLPYRCDNTGRASGAAAGRTRGGAGARPLPAAQGGAGEGAAGGRATGPASPLGASTLCLPGVRSESLPP